MKKFTLMNNTDTVDIAAKSIGIDVRFEELSPMHTDRGLHIQIRHNRDKATFETANQVAKMITAAPDMLEALEEFLLCGPHAGQNRDLLALVERVVEKAKGNVK